MAKKPEISDVKEIPDDWLSDLNMKNVDKSAELDIKSTFKIGKIDKSIGKSETITAKINELPKLTRFADNNDYYTMLLEIDKIEYQFNCNAKSFRFQLAVLQKKHGNLVGKTIKITKVIGSTKEYKNAELYQLVLVD